MRKEKRNGSRGEKKGRRLWERSGGKKIRERNKKVGN